MAVRRRSLMAGIGEKPWGGEPTSSPDQGAKTWSYLTPEEVAESLRVTRVTIYAWLKMGKLAGERAGKGWRIRPEDVQAFMRESSELSSRKPEPSSRLYTREEILEFLKEDEVDPELIKRVEERLQAG
jgi:excisionase family DNA binding protein